jgi:hypothetical protein
MWSGKMTLSKTGKKIFKNMFSRVLILAVFLLAFTTSPAAAELTLESVYPNQGALGQELAVTLKGTGFDENTRVSMTLDVGNKKAIIGSVDTPGSIRDVTVIDNTAYVANSDSGLQVIDISNPAGPQLLGFVDTSNAMEVTVVGNTAYVADGQSGLQVIDISNPANPQIIGSVDTPSFAWGVSVVGGTAYVANSDSGLQVIDISNPADPLIIGSVDTAYIAYDVAAVGDTAYVTVGNKGLQVIDISNPADPQIIGSVDTPHIANDVILVGDTAFVADGSSGLQVIDISNPASPQIIGAVDTPGSARGVTVVGSTAYVADDYSGVQIIDISNPASPQIIGSVDTKGSARGVTVVGGTAYMADQSTGLQIIDISTPPKPQVIGSVDTPDRAYGVTVVDDTAYVVDGNSGLQLIDISNPASPQIIGSVDTPGSARGVTVVCSTGYVADYSGLQVIDISNLTSPQIIGSVATSDWARGVTVVGSTAYVVSGGLQIIDISNPASPQIIGSVDTPKSAFDVAVVGDTAYVVMSDGLQVIDISYPASPKIIGSVNTPGWAMGVTVVGDTAYVADYSSGLQVIDISSPASPQIIGSVDTPHEARNVTVVGNIAYVADNYGGLQAIDIKNPQNPQIIGTVDTGDAYDLTVVDNIAYVADNYDGLVIVPLPAEIAPVTINSEKSISVTLPSPDMAGNYNLRVFNGEESFEITGFSYVKNFLAASASPAGGFFNIDQSITLSSNKKADIYYTTDGSTPTTSSTKYTSVINISETTTLKFLAVDTAENQSAVYTEIYTLDADPPDMGSISISDNSGYTNQKKPTLQLSSQGAAHMRFALSEEALSAASWLVFAETWNNFDISAGGEGAKTVWAEFKDLAENIQTIHVSDSTVYDTTAPVSQVDKIGGIYEESVTVQLSTEEGAAIYYTIDGSIPATTSSKYSTPISITGDTTLKFFAIDKAGNAESVHTENYIIPVLSEITINSDSTHIDKYKGTIQFSATGVYKNIDAKNITSQVEWICSNSDVVTIDENGLLTAVKSGSYAIEISAKAGEIASNKISVLINIPVALESIEILPDYLVLTAPDVTEEVTAIGYYSDETTEDITIPAAWTSNDTSIVSVNTFGTVTAKGYGSTTLSAMKDGITAQIKVAVGDLDQTEIEDIIKNRGNLILVTGGGIDDALWPVSNALSDYVYKVFVSRGFTDDDIYFLNPESDHDYNSDGISDDIVDDSNPTPEAIQEAISTWAKQTDTQGPLYLVLVDHGGNQQFLVNNQGSSGILTAAQLNQWLNDFQTATGRQVVVIIEACQSGSFVDALKHTNRVVMTSTETGKNSNLNNKFSFGKFFLSSIFKGTDLKNAYDIAGNKLKYLPAPWKNQVPQFDDLQDGSLAQSIFVGGNFKIASAGPVISGEVTTSVANDGKVTINATVTDLEGLQEVWAIALPPDFTPQYDVVDFNTPDLTGLPTFDMTKEDGTDAYSVSTYSIAKAGDHKVIVYAMDTEGNTVNSGQKIVTITGVNPTCQISLAEGWNLISLCREPADSSINAVLADIKDNVASAWKWVDGNWAVCLPGLEDEGASYASSKGFGQLTEIVCGEGFWVNSSINQSVSVSGTQPADTSCLLTSGWNLVGLKSNETKAITDLVSEKEDSITSVWKWDNGKWAVYLPGKDDGGDAYAKSKGFSLLGDINPGEGFWVNCTEAVTLD